jgi:hypothetical protein
MFIARASGGLGVWRFPNREEAPRISISHTCVIEIHAR